MWDGMTPKDSFLCDVLEYSAGAFAETSISAIAEIPLAIYLNGRKVIRLLCTGKDPEALAVGFLKSEGFLKDRDDLIEIEIEEESRSLCVHISAHCRPFPEDTAGGSVILGSSGGAGFDKNPDPVSEINPHSDLKVSSEEILFFMRELDGRSELFRATGGCHNAALCEPGRILIFCEDLGRHNAIDMICGKCFLEDIDTRDKLIVTTGRIGSEILVKALRIGVSVLASRSAATRLSIHLARKTGMTLIGYVRKNRLTVYNHAGRIRGIS